MIAAERRAMTGFRRSALVAAWLAGGLGSAGAAPARPASSADQRAADLVAAMTLDEKIALLHTRFGTPTGGKPAPPDALMSAGVAPGMPRLGIPPLEETDAGLGVADPANTHFDATAMPSGPALGASFDPELAAAVGAAIGAEARDRGLGVVLGGGANLIREPRGGRNFEYVSEDPLLTGLVAGASIRGVQSNHLVCTLKHFAFNDQENGRVMYSARLGEAAARESDLLAFEIALEAGHPGAVMTSYNRVDGTWASSNAHLLTDVLKGDWRFPGWVLSDWGGVHSTVDAALAGLDQESGEENDKAVYFGAPLKAAVAEGRVPQRRIDDMLRRQLAARIAAGLLDDPPRPGAIRDRAAHLAVAQEAAAAGIVLLKNEGGILPLSPGLGRVLVIGRMADKGVLSGGGSSQVVPDGAIRARGEPRWMFYGEPKLYDPSSPLAALRARLPGSRVEFLDGSDLTAATNAARGAAAVVIVAEQWSNESLDHETLALPHEQDALIAAVAAANPRVAVVLQTGGAVTMPWLPAVPAVLEAWYSGARGGEAVADVLTGAVNPSGRLPMTFPASEAQLPRPVLPNHADTANNAEEPLKGPWFTLDYDVEGPDVGYRWFLRQGRAPLFPFGHGLSYTRFEHTGLDAAYERGRLRVTFDGRDAGALAGIDTPQVYVEGDGLPRRLVGWQRIALRPGESRRLTLTVDPRFVARYDVAAHGWHVAAGSYRVSLRSDARSEGLETIVVLPDRRWPAEHGACGGIPCPEDGQAQR